MLIADGNKTQGMNENRGKICRNKSCRPNFKLFYKYYFTNADCLL